MYLVLEVLENSGVGGYLSLATLRVRKLGLGVGVVVTALNIAYVLSWFAFIL